MPQNVQARVKERAFFVVQIDETETMEYSDFERASDSAR